MSELRRLLFKRYDSHHSRVNLNMDPRGMSNIILGELELTYGHLLDGLSAGSKVLDMGCGAGFLLYWLSECKKLSVMGVDISSSQIESVRSNVSSAEVYCADGLEFTRGYRDHFDAIFCFDVLEHLEDEDSCLHWIQAARKALRPGGFLVCRVPNAAHLTGAYMRYNDLTHRRSFTGLSLLQLMEAGRMTGCRSLPVRVPHLKGKIRLWLESTLHRVLFRLSCHPPEDIFTYNVSAVGFRRD